MTETEAEPCFNGCTRKDETGAVVPLRATYGAFCGRCYRRAEMALELAGPLVEHLLSLVPLGSAAPLDPTGIHGSKSEAPIPGRWEALSDAQHVYYIVAMWSTTWARRLGYTPRLPIGSPWLDERGNVVGFKTSDPGQARREIEWLASIVRRDLEQIFDECAPDEIHEFLEWLAIIDALRYRWPTEDRPTQDKTTTCPACRRAGGIVVYAPDYRGQDQRVVCTLCGHHLDTTPIAGPLRSGQTFMPNEYELARLDEARSRRKAHAAAERKRARAQRDAERMAAADELVDHYQEQPGR